MKTCLIYAGVPMSRFLCIMYIHVQYKPVMCALDNFGKLSVCMVLHGQQKLSLTDVVFRVVQLSHCRTCVRQEPRNVILDKTFQHCVTQGNFRKLNLMSLLDVSFAFLDKECI